MRLPIKLQCYKNISNLKEHFFDSDLITNTLCKDKDLIELRLLNT